MGSYIGKKPTDVPLTSSDITDNIITSAKIVDGTIVNADINDVAATKLSGTIADARISASSVNQHASDYITWQSVVTAATLTAVAGRGYPINTTSNACTVTLPVSASVGDTIKFVDYARNWGTNALTLTSGLNFQGSSSIDPIYDTNGQALTITYVDVTKGWIPTVNDDVTWETDPSYSGVQYLVVGGGGGGGHGYTGGYYAGGGGAGGYRNSFGSETSGRSSSTESTINFTPSAVYTVTVGAVGAGGASNGLSGTSGGNSSITGTGVSITSIGGGAGQGGSHSDGSTGFAGGSGGGAADGTAYTSSTGGLGTANQGFDGGDAAGNSAGGGGGAAGEGDDAVTTNETGGAGLASNITDSSVTRAAGGMGAKSSAGSSKTANSGDGGDGTNDNTKTPSAGAAGVVIITIPTANYSGTTSGSPTVTTVGSNKVLVFNGSGSVTG